MSENISKQIMDDIIPKELLFTIATYLQTADLLNFSLASKYIRWSILNSGDFDGWYEIPRNIPAILRPKFVRGKISSDTIFRDQDYYFSRINRITSRLSKMPFNNVRHVKISPSLSEYLYSIIKVVCPNMESITLCEIIYESIIDMLPKDINIYGDLKCYNEVLLRKLNGRFFGRMSYVNSKMPAAELAPVVTSFDKINLCESHISFNNFHNLTYVQLLFYDSAASIVNLTGAQKLEHLRLWCTKRESTKKIDVSLPKSCTKLTIDCDQIPRIRRPVSRQTTYIKYESAYNPYILLYNEAIREKLKKLGIDNDDEISKLIKEWRDRIFNTKYDYDFKLSFRENNIKYIEFQSPNISPKIHTGEFLNQFPNLKLLHHRKPIEYGIPGINPEIQIISSCKN